MESNIYVNTNVFIDLLDSTRPFAVGSMALMRDSIVDGKTLYVNSDMVTNAFYIK